jgi:hypothetical protein
VFFHAGSQCNSATQTFDGVDLMGERLANEVLVLTMGLFDSKIFNRKLKDWKP